jgi:hypothetical protein
METEEKTNALIVQIEQSGLKTAAALSLKEKFLPFFKQAMEWKSEIESIVITETGQVKEMKRAKEIRLAIKDIRVAVEKERKILKQDSLREGQAIDLIANTFKEILEPVEAEAKQKELYDEIQEELRKANLKIERTEKLSFYVADTTLFSLGEMSEEAFEQLYNGSKLQFEKRIEDEKKEALASEERTKKDNLHHERKESILHLWNYAEPELKESHLGEIDEHGWKNILISLNAEKADADAKALQREEELKAERIKNVAIAAKAMADKAKADAEAKKSNELAAAKIKEEQKKSAELKAKLDKAEAERKTIADKQAADVKAKELADKKLAKAPDKVKLKKAIDDCPLVIIYCELKSEESQKVASEISDKFTAFKKWANTLIETL